MPAHGRAVIGAVLAALILLTACGAPQSAPDFPGRGTAGNALVEDTAYHHNDPPAQIWIGFNSQQEWDKLKSIGTETRFFVRGRVVRDTGSDWDFYLDPDTTQVAESLVGELAQPVRNVKENLAWWSGDYVTFEVTLIRTGE